MGMMGRPAASGPRLASSRPPCSSSLCSTLDGCGRDRRCRRRGDSGPLELLRSASSGGLRGCGAAWFGRDSGNWRLRRRGRGSRRSSRRRVAGCRRRRSRARGGPRPCRDRSAAAGRRWRAGRSRPCRDRWGRGGRRSDATIRKLAVAASASESIVRLGLRRALRTARPCERVSEVGGVRGGFAQLAANGGQHADQRQGAAAEEGAGLGFAFPATWRRRRGRVRRRCTRQVANESDQRAAAAERERRLGIAGEELPRGQPRESPQRPGDRDEATSSPRANADGDAARRDVQAAETAPPWRRPTRCSGRGP